MPLTPKTNPTLHIEAHQQAWETVLRNVQVNPSAIVNVLRDLGDAFDGANSPRLDIKRTRAILYAAAADILKSC